MRSTMDHNADVVVTMVTPPATMVDAAGTVASVTTTTVSAVAKSDSLSCYSLFFLRFADTQICARGLYDITFPPIFSTRDKLL